MVPCEREPDGAKHWAGWFTWHTKATGIRNRDLYSHYVNGCPVVECMVRKLIGEIVAGDVQRLVPVWAVAQVWS